MSCPMEVDGSQIWFTDLWNYSLVPYLHDAVKDCLQLHGKRAPWEDPTQFIVRNYPWSKSTTIHGGIEALMRYVDVICRNYSFVDYFFNIKFVSSR